MTALYHYNLWRLCNYKGNKIDYTPEQRPLIGSFAYRSWHGFNRK